jgi:hypothetical protein
MGVKMFVGIFEIIITFLGIVIFACCSVAIVQVCFIIKDTIDECVFKKLIGIRIVRIKNRKDYNGE